MQNIDYFNSSIRWNKKDNTFYPYNTLFRGKHLEIRLNDFPLEAMYSLLINGKIVKDFNDWPSYWIF